MIYGMKYEISKEEVGRVPFYAYHMNKMYEDGIIKARLANINAQRRVAFLTIYRLADKLVWDTKKTPNKDRNGDGTPDVYQPNVITTTNPVLGTHNTLESSNCVFADYDIIREKAYGIDDIGYNYPLGLHTFSLRCPI